MTLGSEQLQLSLYFGMQTGINAFRAQLRYRLCCACLKERFLRLMIIDQRI